ncbi:hypothetical protein L3Q82_016714, partial [Scortum barcoo]
MKQVDWCSLCSYAVGVPDCRGEEGAELKVEVLDLPVNLRSHLSPMVMNFGVPYVPPILCREKPSNTCKRGMYTESVRKGKYEGSHLDENDPCDNKPCSAHLHRT